MRLIEKQERSYQKRHRQEESMRPVRRSRRHGSSATFLPDMVWVRSHWCWSATDSNLRRHPRYQTTQNVQRADIRLRWKEQLAFISHRQTDTYCRGSSCVCTHIKNLYSLQVMLIVLQLSPKTHHQPCESVLRNSNEALCMFRLSNPFHEISYSLGPTKADKMAAAQERRHRRNE